MPQRLFSRARKHFIPSLFAGALAAGLCSAPPAAAAPPDIPPQEPGVALRVFDVQTPLSKLCTLKPGQAPDHDKLMPTVDWSTEADFGWLSDHFVAEASGCLDVPRDGSYVFRLTSDDGSRLTIDGDLVIDHDGHSGSGFVDRYATEGRAGTTFDVTVPKAGAYDVGLRHSNGPDPFEGTNSLSP